MKKQLFVVVFILVSLLVASDFVLAADPVPAQPTQQDLQTQIQRRQIHRSNQLQHQRNQLQSTWESLTPGEKAQVVVKELEGKLDVWLMQGKGWLGANPSRQEEWNETLELFDLAYRALAELTAYGKTRELDPAFVYNNAGQKVVNVSNRFLKLGITK